MSDPALPAPERNPFWGYGDLLLFAGLTIPCMLLGAGMVRGVMLLFHLHAGVRVAELLPEQFAGYLILFGALLLIFRQYGRPFWRSLGWNQMRIPFTWIVISGVAAAGAVAVVASMIHTPEVTSPMTELMQGRDAVILMAIFGITVGPLFEELAFRG